MKFNYPEGATPIDDLSGLKPQWVKTLQDLNQVEAENIISATSQYLAKAVRLPQTWFSVPFLMKVHKAMLADVWDWAGHFRKVQTIPGVQAYQIRQDLENLCNDVKYWSTEGCELTILEQAARIHHRLVFIHAYLNGNERFSRLISDRFLKSWKLPFPHWPVDMENDGFHRGKYIDSLKEADKGDYEPLFKYLVEHKAKDPGLGELLSQPFYKKNFSGLRLLLLVKAYIRRGYDLNHDIGNSCRPLHYALNRGLLEVSKILIDNGADFCSKDENGLSSFEVALGNGLYELAHQMHKNGYPYSPNDPDHHLRVPCEKLQQFKALYFA
jgi:Fic-DOC domain mobile mystery protein B